MRSLQKGVHDGAACKEPGALIVKMCAKEFVDVEWDAVRMVSIDYVWLSNWGLSISLHCIHLNRFAQRQRSNSNSECSLFATNTPNPSLLSIHTRDVFGCLCVRCIYYYLFIFLFILFFRRLLLHHRHHHSRCSRPQQILYIAWDSSCKLENQEPNK